MRTLNLGFCRLAISALALALAVGCSLETDLDEGLGQVELAQVNDAPPPGCSSWDIIPTDFIEDCALSGGDSIQCSGGDIMCCKSTSDGGRSCSTDPNDLTRATLPDLSGGAFENAPVPAPSTPIKSPTLKSWTKSAF